MAEGLPVLGVLAVSLSGFVAFTWALSLFALNVCGLDCSVTWAFG